MNKDPETAVLFDDCTYSDAQELLYHGLPYTGAVIERGPEGQIVSLQNFRLGVPDGLSRLWDHQGRVKSETDYAFGMRKAMREWHPNGQLKREVLYGDPRQPRVIHDLAWDAAGNPIAPGT
jgi:antitoxin component YwqK of YwqJK toxin-antitoxin module